MYTWFIFTTEGAVGTVEADTAQKAVTRFKESKGKNFGDVVGVIRSGPEMKYLGRMQPTPVFGVICCVVESGEPAKPAFRPLPNSDAGANYV